ncbi:PIN domain-containing protein [Candidatus Tisiphia endosymbiont of Hybos culiciformis]|uniref:PIN domain-containing protein n=1 Tax=Candidatus Tisiphia endosymbiont of Hybos culiciformis TaxID=3139331 RepID=UPI003CCAD0D9
MGLIIDSSVIIAAEKGKINFAQWLQYDQACISPITVTELLIGVSRANTEERRMKRSVFVEHIINSITVLNFGVEEARIYNQILHNLFLENLTVTIHDMLIAASAIAHSYPVLTLNERDFKRIKGLEVLEVQNETK